MVVLLCAYSLAGPLIETLVTDRSTYIEGKTATAPAAAAIAEVGSMLVPVVAASAALLFLLFSQVSGPGLLVVVLPGLLLAANEFLHGRPPSLGLLLTAAGGVLLVTVRVKPPDLVVLGYVGTAVAAGSIVAMYVDPSSVLISGGVGLFEKSITGAPLLAGIFSHSNILGMFLAFTLPFVFLMRAWPLRWLSFGVIVWALILTSSRTALVGAAVMVAVLLLARLLSRVAFVVVSGAGAVVALIAVILLPFRETDPQAFTYRGAIWIHSRQALGDNGVFGLGAHWYADNYLALRDTLSSAASHGHNLVLTTLILGGAFVLAGWLVVIFLAFRGAASDPVRSTSVVGVAFVLGLLAIGATETPYALVGWGPLSASVLVPLFVLATRPWIERDELAAQAPPTTRAEARRRQRNR